MPELPEVEAVCRKLREDGLVGAAIRAVTVRRCAAASVAELAPGRKVQAIDRRAKHILVRLSGGYTLHVHLRMTGKFYVIPDWRQAPEARVVFELSGKRGLVYVDKRALGRLEVVETEKLDALMDKLGPEPLDAAFTPEVFARRAKASKLPAKLFLMDQRKVAGLGNMYAAEALFRAGIDPRKPLARLRRPKLDKLHGEIVAILQLALQSAIRRYEGPGKRSKGEGEGFHLSIYGHAGEPCEVCGTTVRRIAQGGRSTYFCPRCQR